MPLSVGDKLGPYEIIAPIGKGGMGEVWKARDTRLNRIVAIKQLKGAHSGRFEQEARAIAALNHPHICQIYDVGPDYLVLEFVEGAPLQGPLTIEQALPIALQIASALEAAHKRGILHRDLKPANVMVTDAGAKLLDFGLAKLTADSDSDATHTIEGTVMGTAAYMSPEQAQGRELDPRSDVFSLGSVLYEVLSGRRAFVGGSMLETLNAVVRDEPARLDSPMSAVVKRCLAKDPSQRFQSIPELRTALEQVVVAKSAPKLLSRPAFLAAATLSILVVAAIVGFLLRDRFRSRPLTERPFLTIFVADFSNDTGDTVFDGTLGPVVKITLESAGFITAYDRTQLPNLGLPAFSGRLDEQAAQRIAVGQGLGVVISGSLNKNGDGYQLSIKATRAITGETIRSAEANASSKEQVLSATTSLVGAVRKALGGDNSDSALRFAMETLSTSSLEAVHEYATAMVALSNANFKDALLSFSKAVSVDQDFGLAYAGMAVAYRALGEDQEAKTQIERALAHLDHMTERERYRTRGFYFLQTGDHQKCIEEYSALISRFPSDAAAHNNLALCLTDFRKLPRAVEEERQAAAILAKRPVYRVNLSLYASFAGDFRTGESEARAAQLLDPTSRYSFAALAFAQVGQGQVAQAAETYRNQESLSKAGASDAAFGLADLALYEGRFADAVRILEQAEAKNRDAGWFAELAYARLSQGQKEGAVTAAESALTKAPYSGIRFLAGRVLAATGRVARAQRVADDLASESQEQDSHVYAKLIEGDIALANREPQKAVEAFTSANSLLDTWIGHFELGRAYLEVGAFVQADSEFDQCIKRRGEALSLFLNLSPTFGYFPPVYYYLGRVRESLKSAGFAESYRTYLTIRGKAGEDPLLAEVRKRAGL